jgi:glutaminase
MAAMPGQLGVDMYSPLVDGEDTRVRGVLVCRSPSQQLGRYFRAAAPDSHAAIGTTTPPVPDAGV